MKPQADDGEGDEKTDVRGKVREISRSFGTVLYKSRESVYLEGLVKKETPPPNPSSQSLRRHIHTMLQIRVLSSARRS